MFGFTIHILRARRALKAGRYGTALSLLQDPLVSRDRRAKALREKALGLWLDRARKRRDEGLVDLAIQDAEALHKIEPELPRLQEFLANLRLQKEQERERGQRRERVIAAFQKCCSLGRLNEAGEKLGDLNVLLDPKEEEALLQRVEEQRAKAREALGRAKKSLKSGRALEAKEAWEIARKLWNDDAGFEEELQKVGGAWARELWVEVRQFLQKGKYQEAAWAFSRICVEDPAASRLEEAKNLELQIANGLSSEAGSLAKQGEFEKALALLRKTPEPVAHFPSVRRLRETLLRVDGLVSGMAEDPRIRVRELERIARETGWNRLPIAEAREDVQELEKGLGQVRAALGEGRLQEAKEILQSLSESWPHCRDVQTHLASFRYDEQQRLETLKAARKDLREGRLVSAERKLLTLVPGGEGAKEARGLLRDLERIKAKVSRELLVLQARFENGESPAALEEGLAAIKKLQNDSDGVEDLEARILAAKHLQKRIRELEAALEQRDWELLLGRFRDWMADRGEGGLFQEDRTQLRELGQKIHQNLRRDLEAGHVEAQLYFLEGLAPFAGVLGVELENLRAEAQRRKEAADRLARQGLASLDEKNEAEALQSLENARNEALDSPQVLRLAHRLESLQRDRARVGEALQLARSDPEGARAHLDGLGPTPAPLRTMVFDAKNELERLGGLEGGCLLQVEEGGEYLLLTDDRLVVGHAKASVPPQIPILARIRSRHACFERKLSFHGGVQDRVLPVEGASLKLNGKAVNGPTPLSHGDEVLLGGVLPIHYLRPNPRSVSALLKLGKGFEARGAGRVLWLRQGGKEGRVFLGRGEGVHIRVPCLEPEVFLFAPGPGQLRIFSAGGGEVDGKPFRSEAELAPGVRVRCGQIAFRVLPL
ncbi:MAG TPA: hypothetical protein ENK02_07645 [Planctomycetes bacterium]|nr:hypothetical protein [Planctomycetota bacterium]